MIGIDVGDDRQHRLQVHKTRIAFVRFGHEVFTLSEPGIAVGTLKAATDDEGRIEATFGQHARDQARRRRLAVRAGHRDRIAKTHELGQHFRALHDRHQSFARRCDFRIAFVDGTRHNDRVCVANILGVVSDKNGRTQFFEPSDRRIVLEIGALYLVTEAQHDFRYPGHSRSADTDEVDAIDSAHSFNHALNSATSRQRPLMRLSASGLCNERAFEARAINSSRLLSQFFRSSARDSSLKSLSGMIAAAPASAIGRALAV